MNLSQVADQATAHTRMECALQRAEHLYLLGVQTVLEMCVGPSLRDLEQAYSNFGIKVVGNDIDPRWKKYYPQGQWILGDALTIPCQGFEAIVFAPPLSRGCSGRREDALQIEQVVPSYRVFLQRGKLAPVTVLVLPGRSLATKQDRQQFYKLQAEIAAYEYSVHPLTAGRKRLTKYYDLYLSGE